MNDNPCSPEEQQADDDVRKAFEAKRSVGIDPEAMVSEMDHARKVLSDMMMIPPDILNQTQEHPSAAEIKMKQKQVCMSTNPDGWPCTKELDHDGQCQCYGAELQELAPPPWWKSVGKTD